MEKIERIKLLQDILTLLEVNGKAKFDIGTFYLHKRKGHKITLRSGRNKTVKPYTAIFFRGSKALRKAVKNL